MTPELMQAGTRLKIEHEARVAASAGKTESGGRSASYGRLVKHGEPDFTQGVALYLDDITVSFDGRRLRVGAARGADPRARGALIELLGTAAASDAKAKQALVAQFPRETVVELKVLIGRFVSGEDLNRT